MPCPYNGVGFGGVAEFVGSSEGRTRARARKG